VKTVVRFLGSDDMIWRAIIDEKHVLPSGSGLGETRGSRNGQRASRDASHYIFECWSGCEQLERHDRVHMEYSLAAQPWSGFGKARVGADKALNS